MWLQLIYFLNTISFSFVECLFPIDGTLQLTTSECYRILLCFLDRLSQPVWNIHVVTSINFNCFTIDESNQVKISREIMLCQGYILKIALRTRLLLETEISI